MFLYFHPRREWTTLTTCNPSVRRSDRLLVSKDLVDLFTTDHNIFNLSKETSSCVRDVFIIQMIAELFEGKKTRETGRTNSR